MLTDLVEDHPRGENAALSEQVVILRRAANHLSIALAKVTTLMNDASAGSSAGSGSYKLELAQAVAELERQSDGWGVLYGVAGVPVPPGGKVPFLAAGTKLAPAS